MPKKQRSHRPPPKTSAIERFYANALRKIARHVGDIVGAFEPGDPRAEPAIRSALEGYSETITSWATATASRMLAQVERQNETEFRAHAENMAAWLQRELSSAPTGDILRAQLNEQVTLIKSIPLDAAQRVHEWTLKGLESSDRSKEAAKEIMRTEEVTRARATLIARTEVSRTSSKLTQARAEYVGSEGYIWRTSEDGDVRDSHKEMNGKFVRWDTPPTLSDGTTTHAGQIYNCRCYPEPVIPE